MKLIFALIGVLFLSLSKLEAKFLKPASYKVKNNNDFCNGKCDPCAAYETGTIIPIPDDYHRFNVCMNKVTETFRCPYGFNFDHKLRKCTKGAYDINNLATGRVCKVFELVRDKRNCNSFLACQNGKFVRTSCPEGYFYNSQVSRCQEIANNPVHKCSCILPQNTVISNPEDCQSYFICDSGLAKLQKCPRGGYFSERISSCLPDFNSVCLKESIISPFEKEASTTICDDSNDVFHPDETDCNKFILCSKRTAFSMKCPKGFYYNTIYNSCFLDEHQNCGKTDFKKETQYENILNKIEKQPIKENFHYEQEKAVEVDYIHTDKGYLIQHVTDIEKDNKHKIQEGPETIHNEMHQNKPQKLQEIPEINNEQSKNAETQKHKEKQHSKEIPVRHVEKTKNNLKKEIKNEVHEDLQKELETFKENHKDITKINDLEHKIQDNKSEQVNEPEPEDIMIVAIDFEKSQKIRDKEHIKNMKNEPSEVKPNNDFLKPAYNQDQGTFDKLSSKFIRL